MSRHALVLNGEILEYRDYAPNVDQSTLAPGKPRMLPVVKVNAEHDPVTQVRTGPQYIVEANQVSEVYTVRNKNAAELAAMKANKVAAVKAEAETRILAIMPQHKQLNSLALGMEMVTTYGPDPTKWPDDARATYDAVMAQWAQIKALRAASNAKEAEIAALKAPAGVAAYDVTTKGWN